MKKRLWMDWMAVATVVSLGLWTGGCSEKPAEAPALTPAEEVKAVADQAMAAVEKGDLYEVYEMLPPSYQTDISTLVKTVAGKVDAELFAQAAGTLGEIGDVLVAQAENLAKLTGDVPDLELDVSVGPENIRDAGLALSAYAKNLSYEQLAAGNVEALLSLSQVESLVNKAYAQIEAEEGSFEGWSLMPATDEVKAEGVESLMCTWKDAMSGEVQSERVDFVQVEGCWVPLELAQNWSEGYQKALLAVNETYEMDAETRQTVMRMLPILRAGLGSLKTAQTPEELSQQAFGLVMALGVMQ